MLLYVRNDLQLVGRCSQVSQQVSLSGVASLLLPMLFSRLVQFAANLLVFPTQVSCQYVPVLRAEAHPAM